jgi:hypothetical protein
MELQRKLEKRGLAVERAIPLAESWPNEHDWLDSSLWQPSTMGVMQRTHDGGRGGALVIDYDSRAGVAADEPQILPPEVIPGVTKAGLDQAMADDRAWFVTHPGEGSRTRPLIPGESPPPPPGYEARVKVVQTEPGTRTREITFHPISENASAEDEKRSGTANPNSPWVKK